MKPFFQFLVDARCLQDEAFRFRGVGLFTAAILGRARIELGSVADVSLVAITDRGRPDLCSRHVELFDQVATTANIEMTEDSWFLQPSPMTHSPLHIARLVAQLSRRRIAIVYDFIPMDLPADYLSSEVRKFDYELCLRWLSQYDIYLAISAYTKQCLQERLGSQIAAHVTGVPVRAALTPYGHAIAPYSRRKRIIVVAGQDPRKNVECVIEAHAGSSFLMENGVALLVIGNYTEQKEQELRSIYAKHAVPDDRLEMLSGIDDTELGKLYRTSAVTVCPSRSEGFSIPVIEANANACPVFVSNCDAHRELIPFGEDQFDPDDVERLRTMLEGIACSEERQADVASRQEGIWRKYSEEACGRRFWKPIIERIEEAPGVHAPAVGRRRPPRIAFVTPAPPAQSGVADYTHASLIGLSKKADVHVFTDTQFARSSPAYSSLQPISPFPYISQQFDAVVSVIGNSRFHACPFEMLLQYGGACILHDARMIDFYAWVCGMQRAVGVASKETGQPVARAQIEEWLAAPNKLPTLFLSEILNAARPTIFHSKVTQMLAEEMYGKKAVSLPFCGYRQFPESFWREGSKREARHRLGVAEDAFLVVSFGNVSFDRAPQECIWALVILKTWGIRATLAFVGAAAKPIAASLQAGADEWGVGDQVWICSEYVSESTYNDFLAAADAGIQLRIYKFGGLSGALLDCIEAGLPTIAGVSLADAMEAPDFIRRVSDGVSPLLIAEQLAKIAEDRARRDENVEAALAFRETHNFDRYADLLLEHLGLQPTTKQSEMRPAA